MGCLCMAPLTPAMMVIRGLVLNPLFWMVLFNGSYLDFGIYTKSDIKEVDITEFDVYTLANPNAKYDKLIPLYLESR